MEIRNIKNFLKACSKGNYRKANRCYPIGYDVNQPLYVLTKYKHKDINYYYYHNDSTFLKKYYPYYMKSMMTPSLLSKCIKLYPLELAILSKSKEMISSLVYDFGLRLDFFKDVEYFEHYYLDIDNHLLSLGFYLPKDKRFFWFTDISKDYIDSEWRNLLSLISQERIQYMFDNNLLPDIMTNYSNYYLKYIIACYNMHTFNNPIIICCHISYQTYQKHEILLYQKKSVPSLQELCLYVINRYQIDVSTIPKVAIYDAFSLYKESLGDWSLDINHLFKIEKN